MRQNTSSPQFLLLFFATLLPASASITLSQFQSISGFRSACTTAYGATIANCDTSDFSGGAPCSMQCVAALQSATNSLNSACRDTTADPNTLIGMFLSGSGVHALCPNVVVSTVVQTPIQSQVSYSLPSIQTSTSTSTTMSTSTVFVMPSLYSSSSPSSSSSSTSSCSSSTSSSSSATTSSTSTSTSAKAIPTSSSTSSMTSQAATITTTTSSSTSSTVTTVLVPTTSATTTPRPLSSSSTSTISTSTTTSAFVKTAVENGSQTVITSKPEQTMSNNADNFGGGGSPFEIASSSNRKMSQGAWVALAAMIAALGAWIII